ncbi:ATP-dependent DNA helicase II subunit 1 [Asimina triloba]
MNNYLLRLLLCSFSVPNAPLPSFIPIAPLQSHYGVLQALALGEDEMPETKDETVPDEEGLSSALEDFKASVYGENHAQEEVQAAAKSAEASRKRKATVGTAASECANYDWGDLADNGKLKDLTVVELKYYLAAHKLPVAGKKEALISRILTHLGK